MIQAVIYDMDGVIVNSEPFWRKAEIDIFAKVGVVLTEEDCLKTIGYRIDEVVDYWHIRKPWNNIPKKDLSEMIVDRMVEFIEEQGTAMEGFHESIEHFRSKDLKLAVASSSHERLINSVLKKLDVRHYFDVIRSAEKEEYGKPHPAVFIKTAIDLGVQPENCLVIEDSPSGVIAAKAAKMKVIAIPEEANKGKKEIEAADRVLGSLLEINIHKLRF